MIFFKKTFWILTLFCLFFMILIFKDINSLGSGEDFSYYNIREDIKKLHASFSDNGLPAYLIKKENLRNKLRQIGNSKSLNHSIKNDINLVISFMFPEDLKNNLLVNDSPAKRMRSIETLSNTFWAKNEYILLEKETFSMYSGASSNNLSLTHKKILNLYSDIAGLKFNEKKDPLKISEKTY